MIRGLRMKTTAGGGNLLVKTFGYDLFEPTTSDPILVGVETPDYESGAITS
jgi:hypothetical protein